MRGGFLRGLMIGSVVGTVSSMLIDPVNRKKAMNLVNQGTGVAHMAGSGLGVESWIERGRRLLQRDDQMDGQSDESNGQMFENMMGNADGKENINRRVAMLEKRLEELSQRGV